MLTENSTTILATSLATEKQFQEAVESEYLG